MNLFFLSISGLILSFLHQVVQCTPFTYQNDPTMLQIVRLELLSGANSGKCQTGMTEQTFNVAVTFATTFSSTPIVALGVDHFAGDNGSVLSFDVSILTGSISTTGFSIKVICQRTTPVSQLTTLAVQYMATILPNIEFITRTYTPTTPITTINSGTGYREFSKLITYSSAKSEIPTVYSFITGLTLTRGTDKRFVVKSEIIASLINKFTLVISANLETICTAISVQMIAFWATESSNGLMSIQPNVNTKASPITYPYVGFYTSYLNTNQTAISIFYGINHFDLGTYNYLTPFLGPDTPVELDLSTPSFTGKEYLFNVGSSSGTRNYETYFPWIIFLMKRCGATEFLYLDYMCVSVCPDGTFGETVNFVQVCTACHVTCETCTAASSSSCSSCSFPSRQLSATSCVCSDGYFSGTTLSPTCSICDVKCSTCSSTSDNCLTCAGNRDISNNCGCPAGFWDNLVFESCPRCDRSCLTCSGGLTTECTSCRSGYSLNSAKQCVCSAGQFDNLKLNSCSSCDSSCLTCSGETNKECLTCDSSANREIYSTNQCLCKVDYILSSANKCVPDVDTSCTPYCSYCSDSSTCQSCQAGRTLVSNYCVCPAGKYDDISTSTCKDCHSTCSSCFGGSSYECTSCDFSRNYSSGRCDLADSSSESDVNYLALAFVCLAAAVIIVIIPVIMRWTYYIQQKVMLRRKVLGEFVSSRVRERQERHMRGEGDIILLDPVLLTEQSDTYSTHGGARTNKHFLFGQGSQNFENQSQSSNSSPQRPAQLDSPQKRMHPLSSQNRQINSILSPVENSARPSLAPLSSSRSGLAYAPTTNRTGRILNLQ